MDSGQSSGSKKMRLSPGGILKIEDGIKKEEKGEWFCPKHDQKCKLYCPSHGVALCLQCPLEEHRSCRLRGLEDVVQENRDALMGLRGSLKDLICQDYGSRIEELRANFKEQVKEMGEEVNKEFEEALKSNTAREKRDKANINRDIDDRNSKLREEIKKIKRKIKRKIQTNNEEREMRIMEAGVTSEDKQSAITNEHIELRDSVQNIAEQTGQRIADLEKSWKKIKKSYKDASTLLDNVLMGDDETLVKEAQRIEGSVSAVFVEPFDAGMLDNIQLVASRVRFVKGEGTDRHLGKIVVLGRGWNRVQSVKVVDLIKQPVLVGYSGSGNVILTDTSEGSKDTYTINMASKHIQRVICGTDASYVVSCALMKDGKVACGRYVANPAENNQTGCVGVYDSKWNLVTDISEPWGKNSHSTKVFVAAAQNGMLVACEEGQKTIYIIDPDDTNGNIINSMEGMDTMALRGVQSSGHIVAHTYPADKRVFLIEGERNEDEVIHRDRVILNVGIDPATDDVYAVTSGDECLTCVIWKWNVDDNNDEDGSRMEFPLCDRLIDLGNTRAHIKTRRDYLGTSRVILMASDKLIACDGENILVYMK